MGWCGGGPRGCSLIAAPEEATAAQRMSQALSPGTPTGQSAAWVEGFFYGSGQALIHHPRLWQLMDTWLVELPEELFRAVLPLLRRVFSTFSGCRAPPDWRVGQEQRLDGRGDWRDGRGPGQGTESDGAGGFYPGRRELC